MPTTFSFPFENQIILWLQQNLPSPLMKAFSVITEFGSETVLVMLVAVLYYCINKKLGKKIAVLSGLVNIVYPCFKNIVKRLRPYMADARIQCLNPVSDEGDIMDVVVQGYSFPSGHAASSMVAYGSLILNVKKVFWTVAFSILLVLIGMSRFALGLHYPTDVLAGFLIGAVVLALYGLSEKKLGRYRTYILLDVLGIAGFFFVRSNDFYTGYGMLLGGTLGIMFEEKFVNFKETKNILSAILRIAVGGGIFFGMNTLLKLPFSAEFLNSGTLGALLIRAARYAVELFICLGVYPLCFRWKPFSLETPVFRNGGSQRPD